MLATPQALCKPQQASQQAAAGGCAAAAGQPTWAAAPALSATQPPELAQQLLPGFHIWLCVGRPPLQLFWLPDGPWMAGFLVGPGQALPVMAANCKEALATAAAAAQGLAPAQPAAPMAAQMASPSVPPASMVAQKLALMPPLQQPLCGVAAGVNSHGTGVLMNVDEVAGEQPQAIWRTSRIDSLSCSEQLSEDGVEGETAEQQAYSAVNLHAPGPLSAKALPAQQTQQPGVQNTTAMQVGLPGKRKLAAETAGELSPAATPPAGGEAVGLACLAPSPPTHIAGDAVHTLDGVPPAKRRPAAQPATEQAAAAHAVGLATAGQQQGRRLGWLLQPATAAAKTSSMPAAVAAGAAATDAAPGAAPGAAAARPAAGPAVQQPAMGLLGPLHQPALSHESHSWQQLDRARSASPSTAAAGATGPSAVAASEHVWPLGLLPLQTARTGAGDPAAAKPAPAGAAVPAAAQCSGDEMAAAEMLQALAAAAGSGGTAMAMEPLSPLSQQRGAPELSSLSSSRSALHAHLQPCGTAVEATTPTWVTFHLPSDALGGPAGAVTPLCCRFLFQKPLSASDAGRLGRMVMPRCAEHYLPQPEAPEGLWLNVMDPKGRRYQWLLKFWLSHTQAASGGPAKRTYVVESCRPFQLAWQVAARTTVAFYQLPSGGYLVDPHPVESHFNIL